MMLSRWASRLADDRHADGWPEYPALTIHLHAEATRARCHGAEDSEGEAPQAGRPLARWPHPKEPSTQPPCPLATASLTWVKLATSPILTSRNCHMKVKNPIDDV